MLSSLAVTSAKPRITSSVSSVGIATDNRSNGQVSVALSSPSSSLTYLDRILVKRLKSDQQNILKPSKASRKASGGGNKEFRGENEIHVELKKPAPCILSVHVTQEYEVEESASQSNLSITPWDEEKNNDSGDDIEPIVSYNEEETQVGEHKLSNNVNIVQLDFMEGYQTNGKCLDSVKNNENKGEEKDSSNSYSIKDFNKSSPRIWTPSVKYHHMDDFFLIGTTQSDTINSRLVMANMLEQESETEISGAHHVSIITSSSDWRPHESYDSLFQQKEQIVEDLTVKLRDEERKMGSFNKILSRTSYDLIPIVNVDSYDFIQAPPPLTKGENYDKIHRASTSLSISAAPVDVWIDSDGSSPNSRRSSYLTANNNSSAQDRTENSESKHLVNFSIIDKLAAEVLEAREKHESKRAKDIFGKDTSS